MPDYQNAKIYVLKRVKDDKVFYVGSTTVRLSKRLYNHRSALIKPRVKNYPVYQYIAKQGGQDSFYIELYKEYPCRSKERLHRMEGRVMNRLRGKGISLQNRQQAGRTKSEYDKTPKRQEQQKEYKETPKYKQYQKEHNNKPFNCECGTSVLMMSKSKHIKSENHIKKMNDLNE